MGKLMKLEKRKKIALIVALAAVIASLFLYQGFWKLLSFLVSLILLAGLMVAASMKKDRVETFLSLFALLNPLLMKFAEPLSQSTPMLRLTEWVNAYFLWEGVAANIAGNTVLLLFFAVLCMLMVALFDRIESRTDKDDDDADDADAVKPKQPVSVPASPYEELCAYFSERMATLSRELDWSQMGTDEEHNRFTPVQAEVELWEKDKPKRRYEDLVDCLKTNQKNTLFLALGRPGSGKSVSLRELFRQLMEEREQRKRAPVYVNLKGWNVRWSMKKLPDEPALMDFIRDSLFDNPEETAANKNVSPEAVKEYQENVRHFEELMREGKWYFIFDSFDEMPCLMGQEQEDSHKLIGELFKLLGDFLKKQGGGVIASRFYHAPSSVDVRRYDPGGQHDNRNFRSVTLRLQDFNEARIQTMLRRYLHDSWRSVWEKLKERQDLLTLCQIPFYLALLIDYERETPDKLPANQSELYKTFIRRRVRDALKTDSMTWEDVVYATQILAGLMQDSPKYNNEYPLSDLNGVCDRNQRPVKWKTVVEALKESRLCRIGVKKTVSFSHRRFQEYFLVEGMLARRWEVGDTLESGKEVYESILNNTGLRDALVLYCEASENEASVKRIADFCRNVIAGDDAALNQRYFQCQTPDENRRLSVHHTGGMELANTLNFLSEAFYNKKTLVSGYQAEFEAFLDAVLQEDTDLEILEAAVRAMRVFDQNRLQEYALRVFELKNRWLNDIMMQNFRALEKLNPVVETRFCEYLRKRAFVPFFKQFHNTDVGLSIAKSFRTVRFFHFMNLLWFVSFIVLSVVPLSYGLLLMAEVPFPWEIAAQQKILAGLGHYMTVPENIFMGTIVMSGFYCIMEHTIFDNIMFNNAEDILILFPLTFSSFLIGHYNHSIMVTVAFLTLYGISIAIDLPWICRSCSLEDSVIWLLGVSFGFVYSMLLYFFPNTQILAYFSLLWYILVAIWAMPSLYDWIWRDRRWYKSRLVTPITSGKDRATLADELTHKLKTNKWRREYVRLFLHNSVPLTGTWSEDDPHAPRPIFDDDVLNHDLKELDMQSIRKEREEASQSGKA